MGCGSGWLTQEEAELFIPRGGVALSHSVRSYVHDRRRVYAHRLIFVYSAAAIFVIAACQIMEAAARILCIAWCRS